MNRKSIVSVYVNLENHDEKLTIHVYGPESRARTYQPYHPSIGYLGYVGHGEHLQVLPQRANGIHRFVRQVRTPGDGERLNLGRVGDDASHCVVRDFGAVTQIQDAKVVG